MKRNFYPGEDWLYYKIYCSKHISNQILLGSIFDLTEQLVEENIIKKWFFVRYEDPDFHIRIRFHLNNKANNLLVINTVRKSLEEFLNENLIWKLQIDTYKREIERYGGDTIESAEDIFFHDSLMIVKTLKINSDDESLILFGIKLIDDNMSLINLEENEKLDFTKKFNSMYQKEFEIDIEDRRKLNKKYNLLKHRIKEILEYEIKPEYDIFYKVLRERNIEVQSAFYDIKSKKNVYNILGSVIHMGINRIFIENQRFYEMICYDYLIKYYNSRKWKNSNNN